MAIDDHTGEFQPSLCAVEVLNFGMDVLTPSLFDVSRFGGGAHAAD